MAYTYSSTVRDNQVLRNTFGLLALSMIPTALAAWFSIASGFAVTLINSPILTCITWLVIAFILMGGIALNKDNGLGVLFMLLFAGFSGFLLSVSLQAVLHFKNGGELITLAALGTGAILAGCSLHAMTTKRDYSNMFGFLMGATLALIVVSLLGIWLHLAFLQMLIAGAALVIFSIWLIYDVQQVVNGGEDNYVVATLSIYLDLLNIFLNLLQLLTAFGDDD